MIKEDSASCMFVLGLRQPTEFIKSQTGVTCPLQLLCLPIGLQGPPGVQGPVGKTGTPGAKGDKGSTGDKGMKGDSGISGKQTKLFPSY